MVRLQRVISICEESGAIGFISTKIDYEVTVFIFAWFELLNGFMKHTKTKNFQIDRRRFVFGSIIVLVASETF